MSAQFYDDGDPTTCWDCGAEHTGGEPFHKMTCVIDGVMHLEHRCATCIDHYSRALWPEDDWGPYPEMPIPNTPGTA